MAKDTAISGVVVGEMTDELKRNYATALARALIAEYGRDKCKKILEGLKSTCK